ncbi:T9SS type A sorting domain-containing protein [Hymenobacter sp. ASUV-10]|uniref:T9SS type A sorting domain-containing protein n=1 Tax=Hymenobacter aranciens TaxID=3063996 RepID=A0ABT9BJD9_9BACT|nr:T9SS type A sorting domain-containing protein [Hymenobacter sp. ASUV-10]MDO7877794.1 T9SS type A sorting domain-containing protein [Hymenobacter sp. ASUV-10]
MRGQHQQRPGLRGAQVVRRHHRLHDTRAALGSVTVSFQATGPAGAVRQDGRGRKYLDRNFHLAASGGNAFPGQSIGLRLFGLTAELARLQAALKTTQYSGANEDCQLGNNDFAAGDFRVLPATASTPAGGVSWFVSELTVADHFSEFYLTGSSTPLPVELLAFTAQAEGRAARLRWRTASEKNSARFDIERSRDGRQFEQIGDVKAQGSKASPTAYTFLDSTIPSTSQPTYYRLRHVDRDGTASYSPVRAVIIDSKAGLVLYPNPARTSVAVAGLRAGASVEVLDALGRAVAHATADAGGTAQLALSSGLAAGVYIVRSGAQVQRLTVE